MDTKYLIVGGGMTADAAVKGIREHDADGSIVLVGAEPHRAVQASAADERPLERRRRGEDLEAHGGRRRRAASSAAGSSRSTSTRAARPTTRATTTATRSSCSRPAARRAASAARRPGHLLPHARRLPERFEPVAEGGARVVVIGGGFIGSELAASLTSAGAKVTMVFPEAAIALARASRRARAVRDRLLPREGRRAAERGDGRADRRDDGPHRFRQTLEADAVVAGLGIVPNVELAEAAGLPVDNGIVVDEYGRVDGRDDVFAAGDVANYPNLVLGSASASSTRTTRTRTDASSARTWPARTSPYDHLPFFYSDLFDLGYEAVGEVDSRLATVEHWEEPNRKGTLAYVDDDRPPARLPALERVGQGRRGARADPRRRARRRGALV